MSKTYTLRIKYVEIWVVEIEADSLEEAKDLAMIEYDNGQQESAYVEDVEKVI